MFDRIEGRARRVGDDINTDYIIASTRKRDTLDEAVLKHYLLETVDPTFAASVRPGDLLVAGRNFGCGSAMEIANTVILAAGIHVVIAESFGRTFYRNAINNGLWTIECDTTDIHEGDPVVVQEVSGQIVVQLSRGGETRVRPVRAWPTGIALEILNAGGLVPYLRGRSAS
jgi:3-isopropylmalate/(R)-2-methylmalate dehydratase small subunit